MSASSEMPRFDIRLAITGYCVTITPRSQRLRDAPVGLRLLALILLAAVIGWMLKKHFSVRFASRDKRLPETTEAMSQCSYCGIFLPRSQAISKGNRHYCSEDHAALDLHSRNFPDEE